VGFRRENHHFFAPFSPNSPSFGSQLAATLNELITSAFSRFQSSDPNLSFKRFFRCANVLSLRLKSVYGLMLLASNSGESGEDAQLGFAICTRCGYAESERAPGKERAGLPKSFGSYPANPSLR
jgi:hypothetical protein